MTMAGRVRDDSGQTLVEFAIASMLFFATIFGITEFGRGVFQYNVVASLAKEGARYAAIHGSTSGACITESQLQTWLRQRSLNMPVVVNMMCGTPTGTLTACACTSAVNFFPGNRVQVRVTQTFTPLTNIIPHPTLNLRSTAQLTIAR
jgi:Flp pilus assembly protein TadG